MAWRYDSGGFLNYYINVMLKVIHIYVHYLFLQEDPVDIELSKMDGMIAQKKTSHCNHASGSGQACIYCTPKDPFDSEYLKENGIKFMSFHAYLRKLSRDMSKGKFAQIDDINLRIKPGCAKKCNWPKSICSGINY